MLDFYLSQSVEIHICFVFTISRFSYLHVSWKCINMNNGLVFEDYDAYGLYIEHTLAKHNITKLFDPLYNDMANFVIH